MRALLDLRSRGRFRGALAIAAACGVACTSCAAGSRMAMPAAYVAEQAREWPPLRVDGYTTTDGRHHPLYGGSMIAHGDSLTFLSAGPDSRSLLLAARPLTRTLHRDSVHSVEARMPAEAGAGAGGAVAGGALIGIVLGVLFLYGVLLPWAFQY